MNARICKCGCGASLAGMRADAEYLSRAHAMSAKRAASANKARTRRASRDGKGVRVYIAPNDSIIEIADKVVAARGRQTMRRVAERAA